LNKSIAKRLIIQDFQFNMVIIDLEMRMLMTEHLLVLDVVFISIFNSVYSYFLLY